MNDEQIADMMGWTNPYLGTTLSADDKRLVRAREVIREVITDERRACAEVCRHLAAECINTMDGKPMRYAYEFAEAEIMARSN